MVNAQTIRLEDVTLDEDEIDFTDIEAKYADFINGSNSGEDPLSCVLIVDNIPVVDESREAKLVAVVTKLFNQKFGKLKENGLFMPMEAAQDGKKKSKGFAFAEFVSAEVANQAQKLADNHRLDAKHTFSVQRFVDYESIMQTPEEYVAPVEEPFKVKEQLNSWLMDSQARDQLFVLAGDELSVHWNVGFKRGGEPQQVHTRTNWTESFADWSPQGTYLTSLHKQGVALWGGQSWERIVRLVHPNVKLINYSPCETYLTTWSPKNSAPGKDDNTRVWDVKSGALLRAFGITDMEESQWPFCQYSPTEKYLARLIPQESIVIYELPSLHLLDGKPYKQNGIVSFCWRPCQDKHNQEPDVLAFWVAEALNIPARVALIDAKSKAVVRTKNLFLVSDVSLYWQNNGDFLAVTVERHTKTKKSKFTNVEVFCMKERGIPIDVFEGVKERTVIALEWEPFGDKFAAIYKDDMKTMFGVFQIQKSVIKELEVMEKKSFNFLKWSPQGRFLIVAALKGGTCDMEIYDTEELPLNTLSDPVSFQATDLDFDPTGRFISSQVSYWESQMDNGYTIFDFKGQVLCKIILARLKQMKWRPRPPTLLTQEKRKDIRKSLKAYSAKFEAADKKLQSGLSTKARQHRITLRNEWLQWRQECLTWYASLKEQRAKLRRASESAEPVYSDEEVDDVIEETEELVSQ